MGYGTITAHALMGLEARGTLFVTPGMEVATYSTSSSHLHLFFASYIYPFSYITFMIHGDSLQLS